MEEAMPEKKLKTGDFAPLFTAADALGREFSLADYNGKKNVVLVFLRYAGCPLCQMALGAMKASYNEFESKDAVVAAFIQSPRERLAEAGDVSEFPFHIIPDPEEHIYRIYGVGSTNILGLANPNVLIRGLKATAKGYKQGKMEGNLWQLPADFIVGKDGRLTLARIGKDVSDNLPVSELLSSI